MKTRHYLIIVLVIATAALHFGAAFDKVLFPLPADRPDLLFTLNGIGYLGLLGAYFLPIGFFQQRHNWVRLALIAYIIVTIVAWLFIWVGLNVIGQGKPFFDHDSLYGVPAKIIEVILLFLLRLDKP